MEKIKTFKITDEETGIESYAEDYSCAYKFVRFFAGILRHDVSLRERDARGEYVLRSQWRLAVAS